MRERFLLNVRLYFKVCIKLLKFEGNDDRNENKSRPYNTHEMGTSIFSLNRKEDKKAFKTNE